MADKSLACTRLGLELVTYSDSCHEGVGVADVNVVYWYVVNGKHYW
jgi:hypothetical protein